MSKCFLEYCEISGRKVNDYPGTRKYIATADIVNNEIVSSTSYTYLEKPSRANQDVEINDILFAKMKDTKKVMIIDEDNKDYIYSTGFYVVKPKEEIIPRYLYWFFNSKAFNTQKDNNSIGATMKAINNNGLKNVFIADIPEKSKQEKIVQELDKINEMIINRNKIIIDYKNIIVGKFNELFSEENAEKNNWKISTIGKECELNPKKSEIGNINPDTEVSFVAMPSVTEEGEIDTSIIKKYKDVKSGFTYFRDGDILFAKITPCMENGKGAIATNLKNKIGFGSTEFHVIRPGQRVNTNYIFTLLQSKKFRKEAESRMTGSAGQKRVPISFIDEYKIVLAPIEIQLDFSKSVELISRQIENAKKDLKELQSLLEIKLNEFYRF